MSVDPGDTIGPYVVTRELGRGGMGVVYLARDTRLDRDVAIKALPPELASDPARLERFEREAKTLAGLSHPGIAGIYGVEEQQGARYLILEYVEGETLADILDRGPLPIDDAIELAAQIAAGVEAAHEAGVIHRDLKPGNVIVTPDGAAKVLDFGLARADDSSSSSSDLMESPTLTTPRPQHSPTIAGAIMGTAAYMSPEQARGRRVDRRTDVWSFGVVLYEMLVGASPFRGETATDTIGAVLHKEFGLDALPAGVPHPARHVLKRCLERDKTRRLQAIGDARIELEDCLRALASGDANPQASATPAGRVSLLWPAIAAVLAIALVSALAWSTMRTPIPTEAHDAASIAGVRQITNRQGIEQDPSLSPDGRTLLYAAHDGADMDIFMLRVGGTNPINLTADADSDDFDPAFSPDGEMIAFASSREGGGVFIMGATGENPRRISDAGYDPAWSPDGGSIVYTTERVETPFGRTNYGQLWVVDLATGERRMLDTSGEGAQPGPLDDAVGPAWSPNGERIAYWSVEGGRRDIFSIDADGGDRVQLTSDAHTDWDPFWSADSRTVYFISDRGGHPGLWAISVDERGRAISDPCAVMPGPAAVLEAASALNVGLIITTVFSDRTIIERVGFDPQSERFTGVPTTIHATSQRMQSINVSPDGQWIALTGGAPSEDIYVLRSDGSGLRRLTEGLFKERGPQWVDDGEAITFYSNREGRYAIQMMRRDGTEKRTILSIEGNDVVTPVWSPDFTSLAVTVLTGDPSLAIYDRDAEGNLSPRELPPVKFINTMSWSPDGERLLGLAPTPSDHLAMALYHVPSGAVTLLRTPDGDYLDGFRHGLPGWIDDDRVLSFNPDHKRAYVTDVVTGETRWVDGYAGDTLYILRLVNGDTLYTNRFESDADLWMIELAGGAAED